MVLSNGQKRQTTYMLCDDLGGLTVRIECTPLALDNLNEVAHLGRDLRSFMVVIKNMENLYVLLHNLGSSCHP